MTHQPTMTGDRYKLNLSLMTNDELRHEYESVRELQNVTAIGGNSHNWFRLAVNAEKELIMRGIAI